MSKYLEYLWFRVQQGDEKAFDALFNEFYAPLCAFAERLLKNRPEAEETVQDVFVNIWNNRAGIKLINSLKSYLYQSVHNRALNRIYHSKSAKFGPNQTAGKYQWDLIRDYYVIDDSIILKMEARETRELIERAIEKLPDACRKIFIYSRHEGMTYEQISEKLKISQNTVRVQIFRALKIIRDFIDNFHN